MSGKAVRASRVRKCRFQHHCPACHGAVLTGQSEALVSGRGWCHTECVVSAQRQG